MEFIPAVILWVLSVVRLPAAFDSHRGSVFRATILAAVACTLYIPVVYYSVDPLLGGRNRVGLVTLLSLLLGFWQFRTAILLAAVPDVHVRRRQLAFGRWVAGFACSAVTVAFLTSRVEVTDPNLPLTYGDQLGMAVFLWTGSAFIMWICVDIARVCRRNLPQMHAQVFRSAFALIAGGCFLFALMLLDRVLYGAIVRIQGSENATTDILNVFYWFGEPVAVLLVSLGLLLPRLTEQLKHRAFGIRIRRLLLEVRPIWNRVAANQRSMVLEKHRASPLIVLSRHAETQLHRRIVEIRDCEMARQAPNLHLTPRERSVVERAELALQKRTGAGAAS